MRCASKTRFSRSVSRLMRGGALGLALLAGGTAALNSSSCSSKKASEPVPTASSWIHKTLSSPLKKVIEDASFSPAALLQEVNELVYIHPERPYKKAVSLLEELIQKCPGSDYAAIARMRIAYIEAHHTRDLDAAIANYQQIAKDRPGTDWAAHALFEIAQIRLEMGQPAEAITVYEQILNDPKSRKEWRAAAALYAGRTRLDYSKDIKGALEYFKQAGKIMPESRFAVAAREYMERGPLTPEKLLERCPKGIGGRESCERLARDFKGTEGAKKAAFWLGMNKFRDGAFTTALEHFNTFLEQGGDPALNSFARFFAGLCCRHLGDNDQALAFLSRATENLTLSAPEIRIDMVYGFSCGYFSKDMFRAIVELETGDILSRVRGSEEKALEHYKRAEKYLKESAGDGNKYMLKIAGAYAYRFNEIERALQVYRRIQRSTSNCLFANNEITAFLRGSATLEKGFLLFNSGKEDEAFDLFNKVIKAEVNDSTTQRARLAKGYILMKGDKYKAAAETWLQIPVKSRERDVAVRLKAIYQENSPYQRVSIDLLDAEVVSEVYENQETGERAALIFLHGFPVTYVPGKVRMEHGRLRAEYNNGLLVEFEDVALSLAENNLLLHSQNEVPPAMVNGVLAVFPAYDITLASGSFSLRPAVKIYFPFGTSLETFVHEAFHYYDLAATGRWPDPFDLSNLYCRISYYQIGKDHWLRKADPKDFSVWHGRYCACQHTSELYNLDYEDITNLSEEFLTGKVLRQRIRLQLTGGRANLAAKYLFMRFLTPFGGREYKTDTKSPSFGFAEAKKAQTDWSAGHPGLADKRTAEIIKEIERRSRFDPEKSTCGDKFDY
jgi:tetratricopeptide (TPR) repeat protein